MDKNKEKKLKQALVVLGTITVSGVLIFRKVTYRGRIQGIELTLTRLAEAGETVMVDKSGAEWLFKASKV